MGCAKTAGLVISLESLKRLFRGRNCFKPLAGIFNPRREKSFRVLRLPFVKFAGQAADHPLRGFIMKLRIRIRNLLRDRENSVEQDGMHVAKSMQKREVGHYVYLYDE
jgi:hypothetical protein